ncbi:ribonucleotide-diphosphate reductase subunit alpha [Agrobacterium tumefaciens]|uniref:ribonucleoside-diphosphate reductase n=1 Tax=Agrobacterium tumefaciens TaxID=358 RepID=A0A2L2LHL7_AGRTU|nr:ribonucleotide-diphosphate reductase subunit alpha [Agrobacterium tumefaciens]
MSTRKKGYTQSASIGGHDIRISTQQDSDGSLKSFQIYMLKESTAYREIVLNFSRAVSIGLKHGVPLGEYVEDFIFSKFEPSGVVQGNASIKSTTSILDYTFRELAISHLGRNDLAQVEDAVPIRDSVQDEDDAPNLSGRERMALNCAVVSRSLEAFMEETAHQKPNDEQAIEDWETMRNDIATLIEQLTALYGDLLSKDSSKRRDIDGRRDRLAAAASRFFERHSQTMDVSVRMSLAAAFVGLFNTMGATMALVTPVLLALFGGGTVTSILKKLGPTKDQEK